MGKNFRPTLEVAPDQELVTTGPYRIIRHPIYLAFLLMLASTGLLSANWFIGIVGVLLIASITLVRIPAEEAALDARFGKRYRQYKESTPMIFPLPSGTTYRGNR